MSQIPIGSTPAPESISRPREISPVTDYYRTLLSALVTCQNLERRRIVYGDLVIVERHQFLLAQLPQNPIHVNRAEAATGRTGCKRGNGGVLRGGDPETAIGPLWLAQRGEAMSIVTTKKTITKFTRQTLGVSVNPHLFRASAATTAALHAGDHPRLACALLQHVDARVTEVHYNRASSLQAGIQYGALVDKAYNRTKE